MKIRTGFVTNSSSASYLLAFKGNEFNERQKEAVLSYVKKLLFDGETITKDNLAKWAKGDSWVAERYEDEIKTALDQGFTLHSGWVDYECSDDRLANIYSNLFRILELHSDGNFTAIDDDLSY